jgi:hypothetical protein
MARNTHTAYGLLKSNLRGLITSKNNELKEKESGRQHEVPQQLSETSFQFSFTEKLEHRN